ncbi:MAG: ribonuclease [Thermoleophilaceae bacterium]|nr:ribonuclease [Thermoleophilaceae bacterium]
MSRASAAGGVAVLAKRGRFLVAEPAFERGRTITLDQKGAKGAAVGDLVLLGVGKRGVRVARRIGRPDVARDAIEGLMLDRGLRRAFPRVVEDEAHDAAAAAPWDGPRRDLTDLPTFTIDPKSARDFDDAVSARREGDRTRIWVHIADVSAYVRPGSVIERETLRRATSVYVPGAVEPMLPEALSNEACSLVPGVPRSAVTVEVEMDGPDVVSASFYRSTIRSDKRLAYDEVDEVFAGTRRAEEPWGEPLVAARSVAAALEERREQRGALAIESSEPQFDFDDRGQVTGVRRERQTESHRLIEHLMILANEQVARYLSDRKAPTLYRVHERPDPSAIAWLIARLETLGVPTPPVPESMSPQQASELAGAASRLVAEHVRRTGHGEAGLGSMVLRAMKQAYYSPRNMGHAGLQSTHYCHFTSPIRRYPDLVAHRALLAALGIDDAAPRGEELEDAGTHASDTERDAMRIERDADDVCLAFLLERQLFEQGFEQRFEGEVVSVIGAGAFVRFGEQRFEGMLPVRHLRGDWWELNEHETMLVAEESGRTIRIGDPIHVEVARVDTLRGRVDLVPAPSA